MATIYHYCRDTGAFLHSGDARTDPIYLLPMVPAHATLKAPPKAANGEVRV